MTTNSLTNTLNGKQMPSTGSSTNPAGTSGNYNLTSQDFVKMMLTQLQNQDPTAPTSSADIMSQMSQIGQLQSTTQLQTTMQSLALQTQIGSASSLIGKSVQGLDTNNKPVTGIVNSVQVAGGNVQLELDTGMTLALSGVTSIGQAAAATTPGSTPATPPTN
jgi:flagellar basal-body rod modification protein FlgD